MYKIGKQFHFSAGHRLLGLADDHPCSRMHGHNYVVEVQLCSYALGSTGFVLDYGKLSPVREFIDKTFDHRVLNDVMPLQPSAENIARYLFDHFEPLYPQLCCVRVSETPGTWAEYSHD